MAHGSHDPRYLADQRRIRRFKRGVWIVSMIVAGGSFAAVVLLADVSALGLVALGLCLLYVVGLVAGTLASSKARYLPDGRLISEVTEENSRNNPVRAMAYGARYREYGKHDYRTYRPDAGRPAVDPEKTADRIDRLSHELEDLVDLEELEDLEE